MLATAIDAAENEFNTFVPDDLIANLDSPQAPDPNWVDEKQAFLQGVEVVWGYRTGSKAILNTWKKSAPVSPPIKEN